MKQVLETIIKSIVENQEAIAINEKEEAEKVIYEVKVDDKDMGRVIGNDSFRFKRKKEGSSRIFRLGEL